jgi:hypothetical protein
MAFPRILTAPIGRAAQIVGRTYDYATPGAGTSTLTNAGRSITDRNQVYTGGYKDGNPSFTQVQGAYTGAPSGQGNGTYDPSQAPGGSGGGGGYSSGGGGGGGGRAAAPHIDQANSVLGQLPGQRNIFNSNLNDTFSKYRTKLDNQWGRDNADYTQNRTNTITEQQAAKNQIDSQVRARSAALQRLFGLAGAGDSQAAYELAPYAAARTGTQMRSQINNSYGKNLSGLDQSWGRYDADYRNNLLDLDSQKENKRREQEAAFAQREADARQNLGQGQTALSYANGGNAAQAKAIHDQTLPVILQLMQQITDLGRQQVAPTIKDASYAAPELAKYTTENAGAVQGLDQAVAQDINPYYQLLLKKGQDEQQSYGY